MTRVQLLRTVLGAIAVLIVLTFAIAAATYYYLFPGYCKRLESRAGEPEVQQALESWVALNWSGERIPPSSVSVFDGIVPGFRWLPAKFDGSLLAMGPDAHVRLLGAEARDVLDDAISSNVQAIYFTERSRFGVLVRLPGRGNLDNPSEAKHLTAVSDSVSVFCME